MGETLEKNFKKMGDSHFIEKRKNYKYSYQVLVYFQTNLKQRY